MSAILEHLEHDTARRDRDTARDRAAYAKLLAADVADEPVDAAELERLMQSLGLSVADVNAHRKARQQHDRAARKVAEIDARDAADKAKADAARDAHAEAKAAYEDADRRLNLTLSQCQSNGTQRFYAGVEMQQLHRDHPLAFGREVPHA